MVIGTSLRRQGRLASVGAAFAIGFMASPAHATGCAVFAPSPVTSGREISVTPRELSLLREFGQSDNTTGQGPGFGVSPDGGRVALVVRRADPAHNRFCQALVIASQGAGAAPVVFPLAVQPIHQPYEMRGVLAPDGLISANPPRWSSDGDTIAILAARRGIVQVLGISAKTGSSQFLTDAPGGVIDFAWSPGGKALIYSTRAGLATFRAATDREALRGYHYDARVVPTTSPRPQPPSALPISHRTVFLSTASDRPASAAERALLDPASASEKQDDAIATASLPGGERAWLAPADHSSWQPVINLFATVDGTRVACNAPACSGYLTNLWADGRHFLFLRREGWGDSVTALYSWRPGRAPQRLFATEDLLAGCDAAAGSLICGREASLQPRRLWTFNIETGRQSILFDPNPGFAHYALPRVERLHWADPLGVQGYGDLVVPRSAAPPAGYPMIIVQYRTRGFLKGGIGDEFPILAFAAHGFAVLSIENAPDYASLVTDPSVRTPTQAIRFDNTDYHARKLQFANLMGGINEAGEHASIDMRRVGITGVSDASSSAVYALNNSHLIAVASLGSPVWDRFMFAVGGPALRTAFSDYGFPFDGPAAEAFYKPIALAPNPTTLRTPMLLQFPGEEYLAGLGAISALEAEHAPIDVYVFPGEPHVTGQPAHRLAMYRRNLAWFDFWLQGREDEDDANPEELGRWRTLRAQLCPRVVEGDAPIQLCTQDSTSTSPVTRR
ncbi:MAG: Atxe2 family lasso peptide isopeptidase [Sphingomonas sp.]